MEAEKGVPKTFFVSLGLACKYAIVDSPNHKLSSILSKINKGNRHLIFFPTISYVLMKFITDNVD